jgi:hypothetical protein
LDDPRKNSDYMSNDVVVDASYSHPTQANSVPKPNSYKSKNTIMMDKDDLRAYQS